VSLFDALSLVLSAAGVLAALVGLAHPRRWRDALPMMLDLWVAAGLLRLAGTPDWRRLLTAALLIAVRKGVSQALKGPREGRRGPHRREADA
jgi:hypothetical protein